MHSLERIFGKTISDFKEDFDGKNSYIIMKFEDGGKLNISAYSNKGEGTGQFDIDTSQLKNDGIIGKRIHDVKEEFDGLSDFLTFIFKDGSKLTITSFSSSEEGTAGLKTNVYSADSIVAESLEELFENRYMDARNGDYQLHEDGEYNPNIVIGIIINPRYKMEFIQVIKKLKSEFETARLDVELTGEAKAPVITVDNATVEDVSDFLYQEIQDGIVYTVDEI